MPVRVLDLTEDPGPPDERVDGNKRGVGGNTRGGAKKRAMAWIDAVAEDLPSVGDDVQTLKNVDVVVDDEMMATPDGSPPRRSAPDLGSETAAPADRARTRSPETFSRGNAAGPRARTHHSATLVGGEVYVFGGCACAAGDERGGGARRPVGVQRRGGHVAPGHGRGRPGGVVGGAGAKTKPLPAAETAWHGAPSPRSGTSPARRMTASLIFGGDESRLTRAGPPAGAWRTRRRTSSTRGRSAGCGSRSPANPGAARGARGVRAGRRLVRLRRRRPPRGAPGDLPPGRPRRRRGPVPLAGGEHGGRGRAGERGGARGREPCSLPRRHRRVPGGVRGLGRDVPGGRARDARLGLDHWTTGSGER